MTPHKGDVTRPLGWRAPQPWVQDGSERHRPVQGPLTAPKKGGFKPRKTSRSVPQTLPKPVPQKPRSPCRVPAATAPSPTSQAGGGADLAPSCYVPSLRPAGSRGRGDRDSRLPSARGAQPHPRPHSAGRPQAPGQRGSPASPSDDESCARRISATELPVGTKLPPPRPAPPYIAIGSAAPGSLRRNAEKGLLFSAFQLSGGTTGCSVSSNPLLKCGPVKAGALG